TTFTEPSAAALAQLLTEKKSIVNHIVQRAEDLAAILQTQANEHVLCHTDIHMGNLLLSSDQRVYIVDWDQPIFAPKERDLMFIGGGVGGTQYIPEQEKAWFYAGYGQTKVDPIALAYYRYERIVQDFAEYCEQLFSSDESGEDRENSLHQIAEQFLLGNVIDVAYRTEKLLPKEFRAA
ncbi:MAG: phosphotransferase family protein, partial [Minisyncoccia bacterium]